MRTVQLIRFSSGIAANNPDCQKGPEHWHQHPEWFKQLPFSVAWQPNICPAQTNQQGLAVLPELLPLFQELTAQVTQAIQKKQAFCVLGGDHSCGIGTWSAVSHAYRAQGDIGLIWIDAHLDAHTPETSGTQNIHGMPVSHLLGHGIPALCHLLDQSPKLKPENVCFVGIRSFEPEEQALLNHLGVKIFYMPDVNRLGLNTVMTQAMEHVAQRTCGFGVSIDLDAIDPTEAPGVGCRVPRGLRADALIQQLPRCQQQSKPLLGLEIAEYNPVRDAQNQTGLLGVRLLEAAYSLPIS